uniref:Fucolectin tachylectin-4 pentraxin-1 domain-containing protein n=1 Tax=Strigamia maritima TaxID=126957 RepID=T1J5E4_STRMM
MIEARKNKFTNLKTTDALVIMLLVLLCGFITSSIFTIIIALGMDESDEVPEINNLNCVKWWRDLMEEEPLVSTATTLPITGSPTTAITTMLTTTTKKPEMPGPMRKLDFSRKRAEESSSHGFGFDVNFAQDGDRETCSHTAMVDKYFRYAGPIEDDSKPWWRLDMSKKYEITNVTLYGRIDCCQERYHNMQLRIGNILDTVEMGVAMRKNGLCAEFPNDDYGYQVIFDFVCMPNTVGRYISIQKVKYLEKCQGREDCTPLTICSLDIYGRPFKNNTGPSPGRLTIDLGVEVSPKGFRGYTINYMY